MKRLVLTIAILLGLAAPAWAGFAEGVAAYERSDYATALREWRPLAEQGHALAQSELGYAYEKGQGVPQDYAMAMMWYLKAAAQGILGAQFNIGTMYHKGLGVPHDEAEAAKWYRKAAENGMGHAQYTLGLSHVLGKGVPQDFVSAYMWLNLAAAQGEKRASSDRDMVAKLMTPAQIAEGQRLAREWKPKKVGK